MQKIFYDDMMLVSPFVSKYCAINVCNFDGENIGVVNIAAPTSDNTGCIHVFSILGVSDNIRLASYDGLWAYGHSSVPRSNIHAKRPTGWERG